MRHRDGSYGWEFQTAVRKMGIREVISAPKSPWQNCYVRGSNARRCRTPRASPGGVLCRSGLNLADIDIVEMHEACGGQVACNLRAWERGWKESSIGSVDPEKLNPLGSSIAVGHPFAATGVRIVTTLANHMARTNARFGLVSICGAGATAAAMVLERDQVVEREA